MKQHTHSIAMLRPASFGFNEQTSGNNHFQNAAYQNASLQHQALYEFDQMVALLRSHGVDVLVLNDNTEATLPDAVFLNNWFCCRQKTLHLFPMWAPNRRAEKRKELVQALTQKTGINSTIDWSHFENDGLFLEGTGSMVIDHLFKNAFACISERTSLHLFEKYCREYQLYPIAFNATDEQGNAIYHTNVMMAIGEKMAIVCLAAITDDISKLTIVHELQSTGRQIVDISLEQMKCFAGNMLELINESGERLMLMSKTAYNSLHPHQIALIEQYNKIISPNISHIESAGGGSVRCMVAELFYG